MNWRRGLLRIWAILSLLWIASFWVFIFSDEVPAALNTYFGSKPDASEMLAEEEQRDEYCNHLQELIESGASFEPTKDNPITREMATEELCRRYNLRVFANDEEVAAWEGDKRLAVSIIGRAFLMMLTPATLLLLLGFAGGWALKGFRKN